MYIENDTILLFFSKIFVGLFIYLTNYLKYVTWELNEWILVYTDMICFYWPHFVFSRTRSIVQLFRSCWVNLFIRSFIYAVHHSSLNCIAHHAPVCLFVCLHVKKEGQRPWNRRIGLVIKTWRVFIVFVHVGLRTAAYRFTFKDDQITDDRTWLSQVTKT
jgi:hypothetical protein